MSYATVVKWVKHYYKPTLQLVKFFYSEAGIFGYQFNRHFVSLHAYSSVYCFSLFALGTTVSFSGLYGILGGVYADHVVTVFTALLIAHAHIFQLAAARLAMLRHRCNALPLLAILGDAVAKLRRKVEMGKEKGRKKKIICRKTSKYLEFSEKVLIFAASKQLFWLRR